MSELWPTLVAFTVSVTLLFILQRWITRHVQGIGMLLFESQNAGMALLWLVVLPGTVIHEFSHWAMAKLLGLRTGRLRIWPEFKGKEVVLGSVEVQKSNVLTDSLVGLAPFLGGTLALLAIGYLAFDVEAMVLAWQHAAWGRLLSLAGEMLQVPDAWLWLYLMVAISNAMMPSPSDRTSWQPLLIYLGLVATVLLLLGGTPSLPGELVVVIVTGVQSLIYAFALTLVVDLIFAIGVGVTELILGVLRGRRVVYK
jgi:hypothetical protein